MTEHLTLLEWRAQARPGDRTIYHTGDLAHDCHPSKDDDGVTIELRAKRSEAWEMYLQGRVRLLQRRVGEHEFEYLVVAADDPPNTDYVLTA